MLLLARDCLLLLAALPPPLPGWLAAAARRLNLLLLSTAKAARELLLGPPCRGEALRLRWWPGCLLAGPEVLVPGRVGPSPAGMKPVPVPSG